MLRGVTTDTLTGRELLDRFARSHDPQCMAEEAVLEVIPTEEVLQGRSSIAAFLRCLSYESFADARLEVRTVAIDDQRGIGVIEWSFSGRQIAPAFGIDAYGGVLSVPLGLVCELGASGIRRSRLYFDAATTRRQLAPKGEGHGHE